MIEPFCKTVNDAGRPSYRVRKHQKTPAGGIWIVVGSSAPGNTTGERQVYNFATVKEAHAAGFEWVRD